MTKTLRIVLALGIASVLGLSFASAGDKEAGDKPKCCAMAAEKGEECKHECCVKAKEAGESCASCKPAKKEEAAKPS
ncbi:MAG TPA: hypothetical protein VMM36_15110 [Opitutaceae bacterium]|nr:hypothetical protein [Opitutaceae bacterium]